MCVFGCKHMSVSALHLCWIPHWPESRTALLNTVMKHSIPAVRLNMGGAHNKTWLLQSCSLPGEMKGIFLPHQNIANSCSSGLVPCHGTVTLVYKVPDVWLVELMCEHISGVSAYWL